MQKLIILFGFLALVCAAPQISDVEIKNNTKCTIRDGVEGVCVVYYKCSKSTATEESSDSSFICPSYIDICCEPQYITSPKSFSDEIDI